MNSVSFDSRSLIVDGKRTLILSGEIHYSRVPLSEWGRILDLTKAAGCNCVATYIFWNVHEPEPGVYNFAGQADLGAYLTLCREKGLDVILRLGPYCCAEWNFGGFPSWLRDVPDITFRTWNPAYIDRVSRYFRVLAAEIKPHLKTNGGNVIIAQVENEYNNVAKRYGAEGDKYIAWIVEYVKSLGIDVPALTCEGGAPGAIEAINGFSVHTGAARLRKLHPDQPLFWTENWPGWYNTWGFEHHVRQGGEIGYEVLRFMAEGGSGVNYYMWHGGSNLGRTAMFLQTPSYDFGSPLNEYSEMTHKYQILASLHLTMRKCEAALLSGNRKKQELDPEGKTFTVMWKGRKESCLISFNADTVARKLTVAPGTSALLHPPASACFWLQKEKTWTPAWKSWSNLTPEGHPNRAPWKKAGKTSGWLARQEPLPSHRPDGIPFKQPVEQLQLTQDLTDYCWYAAEVSSTRTGTAKLRIPFGADYFHVFVNGKFIARTQGPLKENRGPILPENKVEVICVNPLEELWLKQGRFGFRHDFEVPLKRGKNRIEILACAIGLIKGDWNITLSMNFERKGIWEPVLVEGRKIAGPWELYPGLIGERTDLPAGSCEDLEDPGWTKSNAATYLTWHRQTVSLTPQQLESDTLWAIDAQGLGKGMIWINGQGLGRFWQIASHGHGPDRAWHPPAISTVGEGEPIQRYYRIPHEWLEEENRLVIFSETGERPVANLLVARPYQ